MFLTKIRKSISKMTYAKNIRACESLARKTESLSGKYSSMSDSDIKSETDRFKRELSSGKSEDEIAPEAFAVVREAASRTLGMRHFKSQIVGGAALHFGMIAEMKTGEGKTLTATLPAYLNALRGQGVHVITVNEYLSSRDAEWMRPIYEYLGLTVGVYSGKNNLSVSARRAEYNCDVFYGVNNEIAFDHLRDGLALDRSEQVMRRLNYAIVDEVDSILIDEARTPLIISGKSEGDIDFCAHADLFIRSINKEDYSISEKDKSALLTDSGMSKAEDFLQKRKVIGVNSHLYDLENMSIVHCINQALKAHKILARDKDYVVADGKVLLIDEHTGRMMIGRRYSDGLHQALEIKESVRLQEETQAIASITFQNFFLMYDKLCGMTGTAITESEEFREVYNLKTIEIPTNEPCIREDMNDAIYKTNAEKINAIVEVIKSCRERQQPVLVGTVNIEKSEELSRILHEKGIPHNVLNAKQHEKEARIVAQAGCPGTVTVATNMAGRGTDIMLGGNIEMELMEYAEKLGINSDDEAYKEEHSRLINLKKERLSTVLAAGGLKVIGSERHESRRIDNQLRGRAGRQGDIGSSQFFISLEDDLMRIFGSDRITPLLDKIGLKEGECVEHPWISKAIERAQKKVEKRHYEMRKNVMRFDSVTNDQRKIIENQRQKIMDATVEELKEGIEVIIEDVNTNLVKESCVLLQHENIEGDTELNTENLRNKVILFYGEHMNFDSVSYSAALKKLNDFAIAKFHEKIDYLGEHSLEFIRKIWLMSINFLWREHLSNLDQLRGGIYLRAIGNKDPLSEYAREAFKMFDLMLSSVDERCVKMIMLSKFSKNEHFGTPISGIEMIINPQQRPSRNSICDCGSGKRRKHCCDR